MSVLDLVRCPRCRAALTVREPDVRCGGCGTGYPRLGDIPVLLPDPERYVSSCRALLPRLEERAAGTIRRIDAEMDGSDVLPLTRRRGRAMIEALRAQVADVLSILEPLVPAPSVRGAGTAGQDAPATLEYLPYLYRDWGWPACEDGENERAAATVEDALDGQPLGHTLMVGAGACRLAYDLSLGHPDADIAVLDVDPILFGAAYAVVHGGTLRIREANLEVSALDEVSREWLLEARAGPVDADRFHFFVGDGLDPPFQGGSWDTVVTPWFIDQGPADVRDFMGTVHKLLAPGGQWVNLGPLRYEPEVSLARRFSRDELFDLAERAGFAVDRWHTESTPYLVSKLNGRGRVERVLAFRATKLDVRHEDRVGDAPPAWLLFPHVPVPVFPGQSTWTGPPAYEIVVSSIDGVRTVDDLARLVAQKSGRADVAQTDIRGAVRDCLAEVHPQAR